MDKALKKIAVIGSAFALLFPYSAIATDNGETYDSGTGAYHYNHSPTTDTPILVDFSSGFSDGPYPATKIGLDFITGVTSTSTIFLKKIKIPLCKTGTLSSSLEVRIFSYPLLADAHGRVLDDSVLVGTFDPINTPVDCSSGISDNIFESLASVPISTGGRYAYVITQFSTPTSNIGSGIFPPIKIQASEGAYAEGNAPLGGQNLLATDDARGLGAGWGIYPYNGSHYDSSGSFIQSTSGATPFYYLDFDLSSEIASSTDIGTTTDTTFATTTYPTFATSTCGITSGDEIYGCIQNAFIWGFYPPQSSFDLFTDLGSRLAKKPPMGYVTAIISAFNFATSSATSSVNIQGFEPIFNPIRSVLVTIMYMFGAVWFFRRVKDIHI